VKTRADTQNSPTVKTSEVSLSELSRAELPERSLRSRFLIEGLALLMTQNGMKFDSGAEPERVTRVKRAATRSVRLFGAVLGALVLCTPPASATLSVAASTVDLARASSAIAIVTPIEQHSEWQGRRIVTVQRLRVDSLIQGEMLEREILVRSLGGAVGGVTQITEGEPEFALGQASLVFLRPAADQSLRVAGRGQGQFAIHADDAGRSTLYRNTHLGTLLQHREVAPATPPAVVLLDKLSLSAALPIIATAWSQTHAH